MGAKETLIRVLAEAAGLAKSGKDHAAAVRQGLAPLKMELGADKGLEAAITKLETGVGMRDPHVQSVLATTRQELGMKPVRRIQSADVPRGAVGTAADQSVREMRGHFRFVDEETGNKFAERVMPVSRVHSLGTEVRGKKLANSTANRSQDQLGVAELGGKYAGKHIPVLIGPSGEVKPYFKRVPGQGAGRPSNTLPMYGSVDEASDAAMGEEYRRKGAGAVKGGNELERLPAPSKFRAGADPEELGEGAPGVVGRDKFEGEPSEPAPNTTQTGREGVYGAKVYSTGSPFPGASAELEPTSEARAKPTLFRRHTGEIAPPSSVGSRADRMAIARENPDFALDTRTDKTRSRLETQNVSGTKEDYAAVLIGDILAAAMDPRTRKFRPALALADPSRIVGKRRD